MKANTYGLRLEKLQKNNTDTGENLVTSTMYCAITARKIEEICEVVYKKLRKSFRGSITFLGVKIQLRHNYSSLQLYAIISILNNSRCACCDRYFLYVAEIWDNINKY